MCPKSKPTESVQPPITSQAALSTFTHNFFRPVVSLSNTACQTFSRLRSLVFVSINAWLEYVLNPVFADILSLSTMTPYSGKISPLLYLLHFQESERFSANFPAILQLSLQPDSCQPGLHEGSSRLAEVRWRQSCLSKKDVLKMRKSTAGVAVVVDSFLRSVIRFTRIEQIWRGMILNKARLSLLNFFQSSGYRAFWFWKLSCPTQCITTAPVMFYSTCTPKSSLPFNLLACCL